MSKYNKLLCYLLLIIITLGFTVTHFNDRITKLESTGNLTVICSKFRLRNNTHNYEGHDCFILGINNDIQ
jgi:hypothetical protein